MTNRIPTLETISNLNRDEFEDLCSSICTLLFSSHRVEDRFGKGNGLDAWRIVGGGVEGWQFRRFNSRLGHKQASHLKDNISLAYNRSLSEIKKQLTCFTVIFNIDPEPGHKGQKGEIERLFEIKEWANETYSVDFNFKGVSWVRTQLLKYPTLRPDLFEDINSAISDTKQSILDGIFDIHKKLDAIGGQSQLEEKLKKVFQTLIKEANKHYERGKEYESREDYSRAINSLEDALHLIQEHDVDLQLEGKILSFLAGVQTITGFLKDAIENANKAIHILSKDESKEYYFFAKGNLAFALYMNQEYSKSEVIFHDILYEFEQDGNLLEIVRTLSHITELCSIQNKIDEAIEWAERTKIATKSLDKLIGFSDISISSLGVVANTLSAIGCLHGGKINPDALHEAISTYEKIEGISEKLKLDRMRLNSKAARARCIWHLDNLVEAEKLYSEVVVEAKQILPKVSTDAKYNLALLMLEQKRNAESRTLLLEAQDEYIKMGDIASVNDTQQRLK